MPGKAMNRWIVLSSLRFCHFLDWTSHGVSAVGEAVDDLSDGIVASSGSDREPGQDLVQFGGHVPIRLAEVHDAIGKEHRSIFHAETVGELGTRLDELPKGDESLSHDEVEHVAEAPDVISTRVLVQVEIDPPEVPGPPLDQDVIVPDVSVTEAVIIQ